MIGSSVVEARGPHVPPLPRAPVVPLEAVVVARHGVLGVWGRGAGGGAGGADLRREGGEKEEEGKGQSEVLLSCCVQVELRCKMNHPFKQMCLQPVQTFHILEEPGEIRQTHMAVQQGSSKKTIRAIDDITKG